MCQMIGEGKEDEDWELTIRFGNVDVTGNLAVRRTGILGPRLEEDVEV